MAIDLRLLDDQLSILWFISSNLSLKLKLIPFFATWIGSWQYECKISLAQKVAFKRFWKIFGSFANVLYILPTTSY